MRMRSLVRCGLRVHEALHILGKSVKLLTRWDGGDRVARLGRAFVSGGSRLGKRHLNSTQMRRLGEGGADHMILRETMSREAPSSCYHVPYKPHPTFHSS